MKTKTIPVCKLYLLYHTVIVLDSDSTEVFSFKIILLHLKNSVSVALIEHGDPCKPVLLDFELNFSNLAGFRT